jgi:hypothetical protein
VGLFRRRPPAAADDGIRAVLIHFALSDDEFGSEAERTTIGDPGDRPADSVQRAEVR